MSMGRNWALLTGSMALTAAALTACQATQPASAPAAPPPPSVSHAGATGTRSHPASPSRSPGRSPGRDRPRAGLHARRHAASTRRGTLLAVDDPGRVTGAITGPCNPRDGGQLPDPRCTPGSIDPQVTQADIGQTICRAGWTATVRPPESQTEHLKWDEAVPAYGYPSTFYGELDHLVPLELGGSNDASNLWPEAGSIPNPKDAVEDALNAAVCDGRVSLAGAQRAIAADWLTAGARLGVAIPSGAGHGGGSGGGSGAPECTATAVYSTTYHDYDVYVHSNQPDMQVTVTAGGGASRTWHTDASGYADVYLRAADASGQTVTARVGGASCTAPLG